MPVHRKRTTHRRSHGTPAALRPFARATKAVGGAPHKGTEAYRRWLRIARSRA